MRLLLKKIDLKERTENDIEMNSCDIQKFVDYIKEHLDKANYLINNKILDFDSLELFKSLGEVFDIKFDDNDYLEMLSDKFGMHYTEYVTLNTNMIDDNGNNISYVGVKTKKVGNYNGRVSLSEIRKITNSYDFLILKTKRNKLNFDLKEKEFFEEHQFFNFDKVIDESNELFDYAILLLRRNVHLKNVLKKILSDLEVYINELMYQAKCITKLSESNDNPVLKQIGISYKKAFDENFSGKQLKKPSHKRRY